MSSKTSCCCFALQKKKTIPKNENSVINYWPSCHSKRVKPSFIFETQIKIFWWNPRAFWPCIDSNATDTFKAQKGCKDIIKIVCHQWFNRNVMKLRKYFLHAKKTKITNKNLLNVLTTFLGLARVCQLHWCLCRFRKLSDFIQNILICV